MATVAAPHSLSETSMTVRRAPEHPRHRPPVTHGLVEVRHPGYPGINILLLLPNVDVCTPRGRSHEVRGVHYQTLHDACSILADNRRDGFFSTSRTPEHTSRITPDDHEILPTGVYYFHLPQSTDQESSGPYPVVPSFEDWTFPDSIPELWQELNEPSKSVFSEIGFEDDFCMITGDRTDTQEAHIIPKAKLDWFTRNGMARFTTNFRRNRGMDDRANTILLRTDMHQVWDKSKLALVPKRDAEGKTHLVSHFLQASPDLTPRYQNRATLIPRSNCSAEIVYGRFASQIFGEVSGFFPETVKRVVRVRNLGDGLTITRSLRRLDIDAFKPRSRTRSPKKRQAEDEADDTNETQDQERGSWEDTARLDTTSPEDHVLTPEDIPYEPMRGRKRRRSFEAQDGPRVRC